MIHLRALPNAPRRAIKDLILSTNRQLEREIALDQPDKSERKRNASHEFHQRGETA